MNRMYGCAPIYFAGAAVFFLSGGVLIYYDYSWIGTLVLVPGVLLLVLTLFAWRLLSRLKSGDTTVEVVIKDPEMAKEVLPSQSTRRQAKRRSQRMRQKQTQRRRRKRR